jgi:Trk K+ transport system NAD-binding subunit
VVRRAKNLIKFRLEGLLLRGAWVRLLLIILAIVAISVVAGLIVMVLEGGFDTPWQAIWWAFLRLSDPGYLGSDVGTVRRVVSTGLTVLGYVVFMGALVAIMIQWLNETLRDLEGGFTPIAADDHVLVIGWTTRTVTLLSEILASEGRVRRFLRRHKASRLRLVLMTLEVSARLRHDLAERLGEDFSDRQITLRSGSPLRVEHLVRVDYLNAAAIILAADDFDPERAAVVDTRTIKTLLAMSKLAPQLDDEEEPPLVVAEINDMRRTPMAVHAYDGPIEVVASDVMVGCLLAQSVVHPGLNEAFVEIFVHNAGNAIHVVSGGEGRGATVAELTERLPHGILLGVVRPHDKTWEADLCLPREHRVAADERLVVLATTHEDALPVDVPLPLAAPVEVAEPAPLSTRTQRILVLGWSNHIPAMLHDLGAHRGAQIELDVLSIVPKQERTRHLDTYGPPAAGVEVRHIEGDFTLPTTLEPIDPASYDAVVLVASDWPSSDQDKDARTILGHLVLADLIRKSSDRPNVVVELTDPANAELFDDPDVEVVVSPSAVGAILAHVALRPELRIVYEELVGVRGPELTTRRADELGIQPDTVAFGALRATAAQLGYVLVGMVDERGSTQLNPPRRSRWDLSVDTRLVVLTGS